MPRKKKPFIDKKHAITFQVVHRSQKDPLLADDTAPLGVLLYTDPGTEKLKKEQKVKYGIYYDDDYDYMQHLRDVNELCNIQLGDSMPAGWATAAELKKPNLVLPSDVFGSKVETSVGLLNKAAPNSGPKLDWDPEIVAALDDDFDFNNPDNELEDDFISLANAGEPMDLAEACVRIHYDDDDDEDVYRPYRPSEKTQFDDANDDDDGVASDEATLSNDEFDSSDIGSLKEGFFGEVESKSRFTAYSMTSSVTSRNENLTLLDDRFEKFYEQYDTEELGGLDQENITGFRDAENEMLKQAMADFEKDQYRACHSEIFQLGGEIIGQDEDTDDDDLVQMKIRPDKPQFDCESILSTHSTLYNHPTVIKESKPNNPIKLTKRAGIPADILPSRGLTRKQLEEANARDTEDHACTFRPKNESSDDRKERKQAVKEERKMRREMKKCNKIAFRNEQIRQEKEQINIRQNMKGLALT